MRQLQNTIHNMVLLNQGKVITAEMLGTKLDDGISDKSISLPTKSIQLVDSIANNSVSVALTSGDVFRSLEQIEKDVVLAAIEFCGGNKTKATEVLKISHGTLYNKLKRWKKMNL